MRGTVAKKIRQVAKLIGSNEKRSERQVYRRLKRAYTRGQLAS